VRIWIVNEVAFGTFEQVNKEITTLRMLLWSKNILKYGEELRNSFPWYVCLLGSERLFGDEELTAEKKIFPFCKMIEV
jgi:hypothetical protein